MTTWYVDITFDTTKPTSEDDIFDFMDNLGGVPASINAEGTRGSIGASVDADNVHDAIIDASRLITNAARATIGAITITGIEAHTLEAAQDEANRPTFPDVVGYAEIARIAGVSRQRVRQLALDGKLPTAVIETAQGPLYLKTAIEAWAKSRNTTTGRPKATITA